LALCYIVYITHIYVESKHFAAMTDE